MTFRFYPYISHLFCSSFLLVIFLSSLYNGFPFSWSTSFRIIGDKLILFLSKKKCPFHFCSSGIFWWIYFWIYSHLFLGHLKHHSSECYFPLLLSKVNPQFVVFRGNLSSLAAIKIFSLFSMFYNFPITVYTGLAVPTQL